MSVIVPSELFAGLARGALIVTGNERAARTVRRAWDAARHSAGERSWQPANALSWRSWTHSLWRQAIISGSSGDLLLSPLQERRVWSRVLAADPSLAALRSLDDLSALAGGAWHRLHAFRGWEALRRAAPGLSGDPASFARCCLAFDDVCGRESLLSESMLDERLARRLRLESTATASQEILLYGVDRPTPAQELLLSRLEQGGTIITRILPSAPTIGTLVAAPNETAELRGCALWLRDRLRSSPSDRLAVIVADLDSERDTIDSVFREVLAPALEDITADASAVPFEFSLGRPLHHEPLIRVALDLLRWAIAALPFEAISRLLLSPFFAAGSQHELALRAELDALHLRGDIYLRPEASLTDLVAWIKDHASLAERLPNLRNTLDDLLNTQRRFDPRPRGFGEWAEWMRGWLGRARWAESTQRPLTSREFQLHDRWDSALDSLASLDFSGEIVDLADALTSFDRIVRDTVFAPESRDAAIQVLGPREAAGSHFDGIWILRAGELDWPPAVAPDPLLPWALQRDRGMPGTDTLRDREAARLLTSRLAASAAEVVFSYAAVTGERAHQRASLPVRELRLEEVSLASWLPSEIPCQPIALLRDTDPGSIAPLPAAAHVGGVSILELQAACGFRAFAELRLGSEDLPERSLGLSAGERGTVVHAALEHFWNEVRTQQSLSALSPVDRAAALDRAVEHAFRKARSRVRDPWDAAYLQSQRRRLHRLLAAWIELELARPAFTVHAQEDPRHQVRIGPLELTLRVDRVDIVDGHQVILDYKTGNASSSQWLGDRPEKPQVPLYALLAAEAAQHPDRVTPPLGAVGFAEVRTGKHQRLHGFEAAAGLLHAPGRKRPQRMDAATFEEQVDRWREVLGRLAEDFFAGDARVRPREFPTTCEHCGQRLLCRVDAAFFEEGLDEDAEPSETDDEEAMDG